MFFPVSRKKLIVSCVFNKIKIVNHIHQKVLKRDVNFN
jgi:hypothetical protein